MPDPQLLDQFSRLLLATAFAIYGVAFIVAVMDLAKRAQVSTDQKDARERELVGAGSVAARAGGAVGAKTFDAVGTRSAADDAKPQRFVLGRIATTLIGLGALFHVGAVVLRGLAVGHSPWSNMYEFGMTATALVAVVYIGVLFKFDVRYLATFVSGLLIIFLGGVVFLGINMEIVPLMDPLKSIWLTIHVFVATGSCAFFAIACGLSILQLAQLRREGKVQAVAQAQASGTATDVKLSSRSFLRTVPSSDKLESMAYRLSIVGFIGWTFTLIAGAIWANDAWGRYWGFDVKEVWTFVIWVLYAGYIHARATRGWRGAPSAWLSIVGFLTVVFNFTVVNIAFNGLHAYSGVK